MKNTVNKRALKMSLALGWAAVIALVSSGCVSMQNGLSEAVDGGPIFEESSDTEAESLAILESATVSESGAVTETVPDNSEPEEVKWLDFDNGFYSFRYPNNYFTGVDTDYYFTVNHLTPKAPKTDRKINNKLTFI